MSLGLKIKLGSSKYSERSALTHKLKALNAEYRNALNAHLKYYRELDLKHRKIFEARVQAFIDCKQFIPRGYTHINEEMKALIAGSAIQLTFGYRHLNFSHFKKILVYPDDYYSKITHKYHQGEVNIMGLIVLSWRNFADGYKDNSDGRNLGLHEMAHALRLENAINNGEYDFIDTNIISDFNMLAQEEMDKIKMGEGGFFRKYAASNLYEFFSVAVEYFFERPHDFYEYHSGLYLCLSQKLKQDPRLPNKVKSTP